MVKTLCLLQNLNIRAIVRCTVIIDYYCKTQSELIEMLKTIPNLLNFLHGVTRQVNHTSNHTKNLLATRCRYPHSCTYSYKAVSREHIGTITREKPYQMYNKQWLSFQHILLYIHTIVVSLLDSTRGQSFWIPVALKEVTFS